MGRTRSRGDHLRSFAVARERDLGIDVTRRHVSRQHYRNRLIGKGRISGCNVLYAPGDWGR